MCLSLMGQGAGLFVTPGMLDFSGALRVLRLSIVLYLTCSQSKGSWSILAYWSPYNRNYLWKLSIMWLSVNVIRKEEYSLTRPFWLDGSRAAFIWNWEIDFGKTSSSQIRLSNSGADSWFILLIRSLMVRGGS